MKGNCKRCGCCCSDILPVTPEEIAVLRQYAATHRVKDKQRNKGKCPFLRRRRCAVYKVRPAICRIYDCTEEENKLLHVFRTQIGIAEPHSIRAEVFKA